MVNRICLAATVVSLSFMCSRCHAQNINITAPFTNNTGSFNSGGFSGNFSRGSRRQSTTTTPSLTTQNGFGGTLFSGQLRPFATGVIPVVGQGGDVGPRQNYVELPAGPDNGVTRALQSGQLNFAAPPRAEFQPSGPTNYSASESTAVSGDLSVGAIKADRQRRIAAQNQIINGIIESGQQLEQERQFVLARSKYREALMQTSDRRIKDRINRLIKATRLKD